MTKFNFLIVFTTWDIGRYVYFNCMFLSLLRQIFWNKPYQDVFLHDEKSKNKNSNILRTKGVFQMK